MSFDKERVIALIDEVELAQCGPVGLVYFIASGGSGRCKIGFTSGKPEKRLKNLQTGSPDELALLLAHPGTPATEAELHARFASSCVRGEWFEMTDELRAYMTAALWAMSEITIRQGERLTPWMSIGLETTLTNLNCISESLSELLESSKT